MLEVLFEDEALIAYAKPSGLLIAPDRWDKGKANLCELVHAQHPDWFNAHRLDRDTSGLVVFAKNAEVLRRLCRLFETRQVEKDYLAIVEGVPDWQERRIDAPLLPDRRHLMRVDPRGKKASSSAWVLRRYQAHALLRLRPHTGRSHQLRAHCRELGFPILSDPLYGREGIVEGRKRPGEASPLIARTALHAQRLAFVHPVHGQALCIEAPLPEDWLRAQAQLEG
ncbi:MAG: RluA family pseudouridine synthase [Myxococcota bacterium]|jgi:RluA family pseudouridine synthase|nr:RluA family pseudouridine synthase [Myxococcota bacterium]